MAALRGYLSRQVPKSAILGVLLAGTLVALRKLIIPAIGWFDASRRWSILRPSKGPGA